MKKSLVFGIIIILAIAVGIYFWPDSEIAEEICVGEGESLGAVIPENAGNECCEGLVTYVPEGLVGTMGTCVRCANEGEDVYVEFSDGPVTCCSGFTFDPVVGSSTLKGRCIL